MEVCRSLVPSYCIKLHHHYSTVLPVTVPRIIVFSFNCKLQITENRYYLPQTELNLILLFSWIFKKKSASSCQFLEYCVIISMQQLFLNIIIVINWIYTWTCFEWTGPKKHWDRSQKSHFSGTSPIKTKKIFLCCFLSVSGNSEILNFQKMFSI